MKKLENNKFYFLPLGGCGEIGMNFNAYYYNGKWLLVDCGITFGDPTLPGVDVMMADPSFFETRQDDIAGLVATHAHEDHIGAIPHLWPSLRCPVYGTPFTLNILKGKLAETSFGNEVPLHEVALNGHVPIKPFDVQFITLTHSIPESSALAIRTDAGMIVHSGDWKLDETPMLGEATNVPALKELAGSKPLALICDSTNVFEPGHSGSEGDVAVELDKVIAKTKGKIIATCFASNLARVQTLAESAAKNGRDVVLMGRSLWKMTKAAKETGYLKGCPAFLEAKEAKNLPNDKLLYICTGSQGEPRAALHRIATGKHPDLNISNGDTIIFSSRVIPGNERSVGQIRNWLAIRGAHLVTERDGLIHVSGHPARDELKDMYDWVKPNCVIPVHGEARHMIEQAKWAKENGVPHSLVVGNGALVQIDGDGARLIEQIPAERLMLQGNRVLPLSAKPRQELLQTMDNGHAFVTVVMEDDCTLAAPVELSTLAILEHEELQDIAAKLDSILEKELDGVKNTNAIENIIYRTTRKLLRDETGLRPKVTAHVVKLEPFED